MTSNGAISPVPLRFVTSCFAAILLGLAIASAQPPAPQGAVEALFQAIDDNDTNAFQQLLAHNTNLLDDANYDLYRSKHYPIIQAAADGRTEIVALLLKHGANPNVWGDTRNSGNAHMTALENAARFGHVEVCKRLLEGGANPNHRGFSKETALHFVFDGSAFPSNRDEIAVLLLDHGANPFLEAGYYRTTAFELAITRADGKFVPRMLRESRVLPTEPVRGAEALVDGAPLFKPEAARQLRTNGVAWLTAVAQRGELEAVEALLDAGVSAREKPGHGYPVLQAFALAAASAEKSKDFPAERWASIRRLLEKHGAARDALAATGLGDLETARRLVAADKNVVLAADQQGDTPLHWAVRADRLPMTSFWLDAGAVPAATNFAGQTALHLAAAQGLADHVARLLAAHAPTDARDTNGLTPLDAAIQAKQTATIRLLLPTGQPDVPAARGVSTPLHHAAARGDIAALSASVNGSNLETHNELGFTPLHLALQHGQLGPAAFLLDKGADVNARDPDGNTALHLIVLHRAPVIAGRPPAAWLARKQADPRNEAYVRYLMTTNEEAIEWPVPQAAAFLLAAGADAAAVNRAGKTVVQIATDESTILFDEERAALLKLLGTTGNTLDARDANGDTALHRAARGIHGDPVEDLIAGGADLNATNHQGRTPLHAAVKDLCVWGEASPLQLILRGKPNLNARDNEGHTALHLLVLSESAFREESVRALLDAGADPNLRDNEGRTPLLVLLEKSPSWFDSGPIARVLVEAGADPALADDRGRNALHHLAHIRKQDGAFFFPTPPDFLLTEKMVVDARDQDGNTALHYAASGNDGVFGWLRQHGASLDVTNHAGKTPRALAASRKDPFFRFQSSSETDIFQAVREGNLAALSNLLQADPNLITKMDSGGQTPLRFAVMTRRTNVVEFLDRHGGPWDPVSAIVAGRTEVLRQILARQPFETTNKADGRGLLHFAAANGNTAAIELLLAAGCDRHEPDMWGMSPLGSALLERQMDTAKWLRQHGATGNVFDAAYAGDLQALQALVAADKTCIRATNQAGISVAEIATAEDHADCLALLLDRGVRVGATNAHNGRMLLHVAAIGNCTNAAVLLLQRGIKTETCDQFGFTPLHLAALQGHADFASLLLKHKARVDAQVIKATTSESQFFAIRGRPRLTFVGDTALHLAARARRPNMITLLLHAGASVNATNSAGSTPLDVLHMAMPPSVPAGLSYMWHPYGPSRPLRKAVVRSNETVQAAEEMLETAGGKRGQPNRPVRQSPPF
jgi:ankyrin repeat protein